MILPPAPECLEVTTEDRTEARKDYVQLKVYLESSVLDDIVIMYLSPGLPGYQAHIVFPPSTELHCPWSPTITEQQEETKKGQKEKHTTERIR